MKRSVFVFVVLIIILLYLIVHVFRSWGWWLEVGSKQSELQKQSNALGVEKMELQKKIEFGLSDEFVEQEARNKLNYGREGEKVLLLPTKTQ